MSDSMSIAPRGHTSAPWSMTSVKPWAAGPISPASGAWPSEGTASERPFPSGGSRNWPGREIGKDSCCPWNCCFRIPPRLSCLSRDAAGFRKGSLSRPNSSSGLSRPDRHPPQLPNAPRSCVCSAWKADSWPWQGPSKEKRPFSHSSSSDIPSLARGFLRPVLEFWRNLLYFRWVMRLNKNQVEHMAFIIIKNLVKEGKVILEDRGRIVESINRMIHDDFQREDQLDQEGREILSKNMEKIRKENIEYQTMFRMIKTKLAKERNLVLWAAAGAVRRSTPFPRI